MARDGQVFGENRRVTKYVVQGPAPDDEYFVADFGSRNHPEWKLLRVKGYGQWTGSYASAEKAFAGLKRLLYMRDLTSTSVKRRVDALPAAWARTISMLCDLTVAPVCSAVPT